MGRSALKYLFLFLFILFPLGQLQRIPLANPQIGFYLQDIVILLIVCGWLGIKLIRKEKITIGSFGKYIFAFWLVLGLSFMVNCPGKNFNEIVIAGLYLARFIFYSSLYFVVLDEDNKSWSHGFIIPGLIWVGFACAVFGLIQYFLFPDIRSLTVYNWDPHYYRVVGTMLEPGFLGLILVLGMILIALKAWPLKLSKEKIIDYLLLATCYLPFALTYSRSAYLSYLAVIGLLGWLKKSARFVVIFLAVFAVSILLLPRPAGEGVKLERESTIKSRLLNWNQALAIAKDQPLLGVGFNFYRYSARDYGFLDSKKWQDSHAGAGVDNSFLFVLATSGVMGFAVFLLLFFKIFKTCLSKIWQKKYLLVFLTATAIGVHSLFNNSFFYPWVMIWFWIITGTMEYN